MPDQHACLTIIYLPEIIINVFSLRCTTHEKCHLSLSPYHIYAERILHLISFPSFTVDFSTALLLLLPYVHHAGAAENITDA